jgi:two-component system sensor histidine kinase PilS (NtrC family)
MNSNTSASEWLPWLGRVRFLVITFLLAVVVAIHQLAPVAFPEMRVLLLIAGWYVLATTYVGLYKWIPDARWYAPAQTVLDLCVVTAIVYSTGVQDSYFVSLYLLSILMASILFSRRGAFLVAGASFILLGCAAELMYYGVIPQGGAGAPGPRELEFWLASNFFAFFAVAYLGSLLAQTSHRRGLELEKKSEALKDLQAFNREIIESMRGGLLTVGLDGRILLINRSGAELTGHGFGSLGGENVADVFPGFWPVETDEEGNPLASRKEVEFQTATGQVRFLGISISPLRTGQNAAAGYVYNFQDLTELKRLEKEVMTKDRMAALGRLSAGIAHEIRQPLTAMTGALKELARLAPLDDDDKKLVQIVSRESQRLNHIISEFLNYSRERSYVFADVDIAPLIEETILLLERDSTAAGKHRFERSFASPGVRVRADRDAMKQVLWNLCNNALRAMPDGGVLSVALETSGGMVRVRIRDTGMGMDPRASARIFEPFQSGFTGGTGLGLAIVYQILQAHHGRISVETMPGKGSEFIMDLPLAPPKAPRGARSNEPAISSPGVEAAHPVGRN